VSGRLLIIPTRISLRAVETARIICPLRVGEVRGRAGQGVRPDGLPVHQIGARLDNDGLIAHARDGETEIAG
jgi:hypothetical protein